MHLLAISQPFIPDWTQLRPFVVELWLIATIVAVLLAPFFARRSNAICAMVALAGLALALISLLAVGVGDDLTQAVHFRGMLLYDHVAVFWKVLLLIFAMGIILMWAATTSKTMREGDGAEFFTLLLGATLGMSLMASTSNLLMIVMAVEMASLPSYVLAGFRKTHRVGAEASLKYVLFGAACSSLMVYGLSLLYGLYGTLQLNTMVIDGAVVPGIVAKMATGSGAAPLLIVAILGLLIGLGFKISAVPFHYWCPDVFEGASVEISAFLSVASKGAAMVLLLRILMLIADGFAYHDSPHVWITVLAAVVGVLGALTATVGNTAAFVQNNIKRLLAYSSIAHAGYMMCALSLLVAHNASPTVGRTNSPAQAILLYLAVYLFMNLGAFTVAALVYRQSNSEDLSAFAGLGHRSPVLAATMFCFMFSLVGLPPFAGFVAKFNLLAVLVQNGGCWWWLVAVIGVNTVLSLYYYMRVVKKMYLEPSDEGNFGPHPLGGALAAGCAAMLILMFVLYSPLSNLTQSYSRMQGIGAAAPPSALAGPKLTAKN